MELIELYNYIVLYKAHLRGYCTPNLEFACFVFYLKIVNIFMKTDVCIL